MYVYSLDGSLQSFPATRAIVRVSLWRLALFGVESLSAPATATNIEELKASCLTRWTCVCHTCYDYGMRTGLICCRGFLVFHRDDLSSMIATVLAITFFLFNSLATFGYRHMRWSSYVSSALLIDATLNSFKCRKQGIWFESPSISPTLPGLSRLWIIRPIRTTNYSVWELNHDSDIVRENNNWD